MVFYSIPLIFVSGKIVGPLFRVTVNTYSFLCPIHYPIQLCPFSMKLMDELVYLDVDTLLLLVGNTDMFHSIPRWGLSNWGCLYGVRHSLKIGATLHLLLLIQSSGLYGITIQQHFHADREVWWATNSVASSPRVKGWIRAFVPSGYHTIQFSTCTHYTRSISSYRFNGNIFDRP